MRRRQENILRAIGFVARLEKILVHRIGDIQQRLSVLDRAGFLVRGVPLAQIGQRLHRRFVAEGFEEGVEVALHAVREID